MAGKTARISRRIRVGLATVISGAALLGGCADGIEVNSPLLDAVGLSTSALSKKEEPKLAPRAPLVMPPSTQRLPEPGQAQPQTAAAAAPGADPAWPKDPDQNRVTAAAKKKAAHDDYCRDGNWKERAKDNDFGGRSGPQGTCGSMFSVIGGWFGGDGPPKEDVPKP
jgi:hypothetical protein